MPISKFFSALSLALSLFLLELPLPASSDSKPIVSTAGKYATDEAAEPEAALTDVQKEQEKILKQLQDNICANPSLPAGAASSEATSPAPVTITDGLPAEETQAEGACPTCATALTLAEKNRADLAKLQGQVKSLDQIKREVAFIEYQISQARIQSPATNPDSSEAQLRKLRIQLVEEKNRISLSDANKELVQLFVKVERLFRIQKKLNAKPAVPLTDADRKVLQQILIVRRSEMVHKFKIQRDAIKSTENELKELLKPSNDSSSDQVVNLKSSLEYLNDTLKRLLFDQKEIEANGNWLKKGAKPPIPNDSALFNDTVGFTDESIRDYRQELKNNILEMKKTKASIQDLKKKIKALDQPLTDDQLIERHKRLEALLRDQVESTAIQNHFQNCGMSWAEVFAIRDYTGVGFREVNNAMRTPEQDDDVELKGYIDTLNSALKKLKPVTEKVLRGGNLPPDILKMANVGHTITFKGFTSTSITAAFETQQKFVILSRTGRYVAPYSLQPHEEEVLFPANRRFKVLSRKESGGTINFVLKEVD